MMHALDRPIWSALATRHAALAEGDGLAKRYPASIVPFAATRDNAAACMQAIDKLVRCHERIYMLQADEIRLPEGLAAVLTATGVQMVAAAPFARVSDVGVQRLTESDAEEMLALASLAKPGPFTLRALSLGAFWGLRHDGRLVAMAGERMKQPGFAEVSGVCTHPEMQGRGFARLLSLFVAGEISARGETPYLHAYATNTRAIGLYQSIGFRVRCHVNVAAIERAPVG